MRYSGKIRAFVRAALLGIVGLPLATLSRAASPAISYRLSMPRPWTHLFEVAMTVERLPAGDKTVDIALPVWRPGRYVRFDFAGAIVSFSAVDARGDSLGWTKTDKSTWLIKKGTSTVVRAHYTVFANEFAIRTRGLNDEHGFVDGTALFMYVSGARNVPVSLTVDPYADWHVTTGLDSIAGRRFSYAAPSYDYLVDCPLEIGTQRDYAFTVDGKEHLISISGNALCNVDTLIHDVRRIVEMDKEFWGDLPYQRFVFMFRTMAQGGGGTEHINSDVMDIPPMTTPRPVTCKGILGLVSHEFFHTWNVKRLRPRGMVPYDWTKENYSRVLWVAEGSTSYLHGLLMARHGFSTADQYIHGLGAAIQADRQRPGNRVQPLWECSFDEWIHSFANTQQPYNFTTDIYERGANVSMLLDLEIRQSTGNARSFDDLMRGLYRRFPLGSAGYTIEDVEEEAAELAGDGVRSFFQKFVFRTAPLEWERALSYAGLDVHAADTTRKPWLGIAAAEANGRERISTVVAGSPAYAAGLDVGDELVALNDSRLKPGELASRVAEFSPGDTVRITVFREDHLRTFNVALRTQDVPEYVVEKVEHPTPLQRKIYESWLNAPWDGSTHTSR